MGGVPMVCQPVNPFQDGISLRACLREPVLAFTEHLVVFQMLTNLSLVIKFFCVILLGLDYKPIGM